VYHRESRSVYFTLAFAGIALMAAAVVGVAVFKRRSARSPHSQVRDAAMSYYVTLLLSRCLSR